MKGTVHIFSNGFEFRCWEAKNCDRCVKEPSCEIIFGDGGIGTSFLGDGMFSQEMADRMGYSAECIGVLGWTCAEFSDVPIGPKPAAHVMRDAGALMLPGLEPAS